MKNSPDRNPPKLRRNSGVPRPALALRLLSLLGAGGVFLGGCAGVLDVSPTQGTNTDTAEETAVVNGEENADTERSLMPTEEDTNFVVAAVQTVEPSVVRINTVRTVESPLPDAFGDPFFRRFFGDNLPVPPQERQVEGLGSGFVIDTEGHILTNAHVVNQADTVEVSFADGRTFEGTVLGEDPVTDIAVVRVPAEDLQAVEFGDSQRLQPGQWAIAIGNPLGLQETVTVGVISGTERSSSAVGVADKRIDFIQTDAAINPGNSGGPLLNARGQVIGVNTAIIQGAQGLGFAIPIDTARQIAEQLIETGNVEHPYVGIQMVELTPQIQQRINSESRSDIQVEATEGILIVGVARNSPADEAGIRPGDVIQSINNQSVDSAEAVQEIVEAQEVGDTLQMALQRQEQSVEVTVELESLPNPEA